MPGDNREIRTIGAVLISRGANKDLVVSIVRDRRLPPHEKVLLLADIYAKGMIRSREAGAV